MAGGSTSQPKGNKTGPSDQPPSYSAIVKGGMQPQDLFLELVGFGHGADGR